jgi:hypothetical protein
VLGNKWPHFDEDEFDMIMVGDRITTATTERTGDREYAWSPQVPPYLFLEKVEV